MEKRGKGETKKKRKKNESRSCPDGMYVCMYVWYWYVLVRYGTVRYGGGMIWLFLFVLNRQIYDEVLRTLDASSLL